MTCHALPAPRVRPFSLGASSHRVTQSYRATEAIVGPTGNDKGELEAFGTDKGQEVYWLLALPFVISILFLLLRSQTAWLGMFSVSLAHHVSSRGVSQIVPRTSCEKVVRVNWVGLVDCHSRDLSVCACLGHIILAVVGLSWHYLWQAILVSKQPCELTVCNT